MFPKILEIGPITLYTYGLMIAMGFLLAVSLVQRDVKMAGYDGRRVGELAFYAFFFGLVGSRIFHIIMYPEGYSLTNPLGWIMINKGGLVFQGALPVAFLFAYLALRHFKIPFLVVADITMPYMALAQAFGRMGCFFYGCCHGVRADDLPWAIRFPHGSPAFQVHALRYPELSADAAWSLPVHPTQLYSVAGLLMIAAILWTIRRRVSPPFGAITALYFLLYGVMRFIVEIYRGDGNPQNLGFGVLTNQQVFAVLMFVLGIAWLAWIWKRGKTPATTE